MKRLMLLVLATVAIPGCATLQEIAALRLVTFRFDRVANVEVAGIPVGPGTSYANLGTANLARLVAAVAEGRLPLEFTAHVAATNPEDNAVSARMVDLAWTLFVEDRKTVSGVVAEVTSIAPGTTADVPVEIQLDLVEFWNGSARELFELAVGIAGGGGDPKELRLELNPTIETSLGPISYPSPIVVTREVG